MCVMETKALAWYGSGLEKCKLFIVRLIFLLQLERELGSFEGQDEREKEFSSGKYKPASQRTQRARERESGKSPTEERPFTLFVNMLYWKNTGGRRCGV